MTHEATTSLSVEGAGAGEELGGPGKPHEKKEEALYRSWTGCPHSVSYDLHALLHGCVSLHALCSQAKESKKQRKH